jgi:3-hydroxyacyl-[acyl-carrier-protein] dehydratase
MVDKIIDIEPGKSIQGMKTVSFEEYQLKSVFCSDCWLPESLVLESFLQLGNWLIMFSTDFKKMGLLVRIEEIRFESLLRPGRGMFMEVEVKRFREDGVVFNGRAMVDGKIIATGKGCLATLVDSAEYFNPDDLKVLFKNIYRPANSVSV